MRSERRCVLCIFVVKNKSEKQRIMKEQLIWKIYIRILSTDYKIKQGKTNEDEPLRIEYIFASAHHFIVFKVKNNQKFSRANATAITCVLRTNLGINQLNFKQF